MCHQSSCIERPLLFDSTYTRIASHLNEPAFPEESSFGALGPYDRYSPWPHPDLRYEYKDFVWLLPTTIDLQQFAPVG
jgi:hypothetical protein